MDQARRAPAPEEVEDVRLQRTQRGIVAGYIHEMSERHSEHGHAETDQADEGED
jgi:hypothetical protein